MRYIVALFTLILSACGSASDFPPDFTLPEFTKSYHVYGAPSHKRILLTHGIWGDDSIYNGGDLVALRNGLVAKGYQVITFNCPWFDSRFFADGGKEYRHRYIEFLKWLIKETDSKYGYAYVLDIGGFSFGGLHAFIGASSIPRIHKYLGMVPVSDPHAYTYLFGPYSAPHFNAFNEVARLRFKTGVIVTSHDDNYLGYQNSANLASMLHARYQDFTGAGGHNVNAAMVQFILNQF